MMLIDVGFPFSREMGEKREMDREKSPDDVFGFTIEMIYDAWTGLSYGMETEGMMDSVLWANDIIPFSFSL